MARMHESKIQIYNISSDSFEDITIEDVNRLEDAQQAFGRLLNGMRELIAHEGAIWNWPDRYEGRELKK